MGGVLERRQEYKSGIRLIFFALLCLTLLFAFADTSTAEDGGTEVIAEDFSVPSTEDPSLPAAWKPLVFPGIKRHTVYTVQSRDGNSYLRGESVASASALYRTLDIEAAEYPMLSWRWKIDNVLAKGDGRTKAGDDYSARLYVTFAFEPAESTLVERARQEIGVRLFGLRPPGSALNYIWANKLKKGEFIANPYSPKDIMIAVQSGSKKALSWVSEERNIYEDYVRAFGHKPPRITGVAVMTDSDNTGGRATGYYDDIVFRKKPALKP